MSHFKFSLNKKKTSKFEFCDTLSAVLVCDTVSVVTIRFLLQFDLCNNLKVVTKSVLSQMDFCGK